MENTQQANAAFLLRLSLGVILLAHGLLKVMVFTVPGTVQFFGSLGLPPIIAYLTIFGEITGGAAIILGVYTKLAALLSVPILLGATWAHIGNGWVFSNQGGGWEFPLLLVVMSFVVFLQGPGSAALGIRIALLDKLLPQSLKD